MERDTSLCELLSRYSLVAIDLGRQINKYMRNNICVKLYPASTGGRKNEFRKAFTCGKCICRIRGNYYSDRRSICWYRKGPNSGAPISLLRPTYVDRNVAGNKYDPPPDVGRSRAKPLRAF